MDSSSSSRVPAVFSFFILIFIFILNINPSSSSVQICKPASCGLEEPEVRFPFQLTGKHDGQRCGYLGFNLSCNSQGRTILTLPHSGDYVVNWINYSTQSIFINDPANCLPNRILNFTAAGSAFRANPNDNYKIFNCSNAWQAEPEIDYVIPVFCNQDGGGGNGGNSSILALPSRSWAYANEIPRSSCTLMANVSVPLKLIAIEYWWGTVYAEVLELIWDLPVCRSCEVRGLRCGFNSGTSNEIGCSKRGGLSRGARYGIIIGIGIPAIVCLIGVLCYIAGKCNPLSQPRRNVVDSEQQSPPSPSGTLAIYPPRRSAVTISGLDAPTIESYPKTVIGESRRLPQQCGDEGSCPICLCEYQPKEILRSIPECNHFFHAGCIDEWLKLNGSCPLCRNSPEPNSISTPCSSASSFAFSTSSSAPA